MQMQYQTARIRSTAQTDDASRASWLGNLRVGQKLGFISAAFGIPLIVLLGILANRQYTDIKHTMNELYGFQRTEPLAAIQSGIYVYMYGALDKNKTDQASGIKETDKGIADLEKQLTGRPAQRLAQLKADWKNLQTLGEKADDVTLIKAFEALMQNDQQQIIEEMLLAAGLNAEKEPALSALITANQRDLPTLAAELQMLALSARVAGKSADQQAMKENLVRYSNLLNNDLNRYEENLKRAYSLQPGLEGRINKVNQKAIYSVRNAMNQTVVATNTGVFHKNLADTYGVGLTALRDSYIATITDAATQMINRVKAGYISLAVQFGLLLLGLAAAAALLVTLARSITRPLGHLTRASEALSSGNFGVQVPVTSRDELGLLSYTFNDAASQLRQNAERVEQERAEAQRLQQNVGEFLDVTMDIADGDLTKKGKVTEDVLGNVVDSINLMTEELAHTLKGVQNASSSVTSGSKAMLLTTAQIEQGSTITTEQARLLAEQAQNVNARIQEMSRAAQHSADSARRALLASEQGQQAVAATLDGMQNIRQSSHSVSESAQSLAKRSEQIQEIVDAISHIASQTNLLSLHASIEAAGAGEAGKRFAIVAEEIRGLAEESATATASVAELVASVQREIQQVSQGMQVNAEQVELGYQVAGQAGQRLREIATLAQESAQLANDISGATTQQVHSIEQMDRGVRDIAQIAEASQQSVHQGRSAAEQLQQLAQQLNQSLSRFRLPSN